MTVLFFLLLMFVNWDWGFLLTMGEWQPASRLMFFFPFSAFAFCDLAAILRLIELWSKKK